MSPGEADLQLLEFAKQLDMYGIKLSPVKDHEGVPLNLSVIHNGILIFQNHTKVNTFEWLKVRKLSFKRKRFFIKLHQEVLLSIFAFPKNVYILLYFSGVLWRCLRICISTS